MTSRDPDPVLALDGVGLRRDGRAILDDITWHVSAGERWVVLGANGSGKTTLVRIAALYEHPSFGSVSVLGERLGRADVRVVRQRIGYSSAALAGELRPALTACEVVQTARYAALEPWWHRYTAADTARAEQCLAEFGVAALADRTFGTLSSGERQRVLLARTMMNDPALVVLDEPSAGLDVGGREQLVAALGEFAGDSRRPPFVLVTHHVDEIPPGVTHVMLLSAGRVVAAGDLQRTLTAESLSECFALPLTLERRADGRFSAWAR